MKRRFGLGLGVALLGLSGPAPAQDMERVALRWSAPEGCPAAGVVTAEVDRLLAGSPARPPRPVEVSASVSRDDVGAFRVRLETPGDGAIRVREVKGASCAAVADAAALIIALMIDPSAAAAAGPRPGPAPLPAPVVPVAVPVFVPPLAPAPKPEIVRASRPRASSGSPLLAFRLSAAAIADAGSLPGISFGFSGAASLLVGPNRFELGAAGWPDRATSLAARPSAGGFVGLVTGFASVCRDVLRLLARTTRFELFPCAAFELGRIHAKGFGIDAPGDGAALWSAVRAGGLFVWRLADRVGIDLRLEAAIPLARPSFVIEGLGTVHRSAPVAGRASLGAELRF